MVKPIKSMPIKPNKKSEESEAKKEERKVIRDVFKAQG
jgi:hypothetical protein